MDYKQIARAKAIERENRERLLKINPSLNDKPGIYFFLRSDENGFKYAYIGQAVNILSRLCSHMTGYSQHIDLSIRKHKLYSSDNPYGWRVEFKNFSISSLDEMEKKYIKMYADAGYQLRNVSIGGQGSERNSGMIGERKPAKGYMQGVQHGKKSLARELNHIIDKHLVVSLKPEKQNNKVSQNAFDKFNDLLNENNY